MTARTLSELIRFDLHDEHHGELPCVLLGPPAGSDAGAALPLCLFLYGGGGSAESLALLQPAFEAWWASGAVPRMWVATPGVAPWSFYLDDPARGQHWERFAGDVFVRGLRQRFDLAAAGEVGLVGMSMGGYGALKIAFARPEMVRAVAAISPMLEPGFEPQAVPLRNRYHYPAEVPAALLGPEREPDLWRRDHPALRAQRHAEAIRRRGLAIYLDASGRDALHAHDGAEHLHRVLWDLDIAHEYRLRRDADHIGPEIVERLRSAFRWVGDRLVPAPPPPLSAAEEAWRSWLDGDRTALPPVPLAPTSPLFPAVLRAQLAPLREAAAREDPTFTRVYGRLPDR